jgi:hypothetical protein
MRRNHLVTGRCPRTGLVVAALEYKGSIGASVEEDLLGHANHVIAHVGMIGRVDEDQVVVVYGPQEGSQDVLVPLSNVCKASVPAIAGYVEWYGWRRLALSGIEAIGRLLLLVRMVQTGGSTVATILPLVMAT